MAIHRAFDNYYIRISKPTSPNRHYRTLISNHPFFINTIVVKLYEEKMIITKPTLSYIGKTYQCTWMGTRSPNWHAIHLKCDIPEGKYEFDEEESTEDCKVIYFKN